MPIEPTDPDRDPLDILADDFVAKLRQGTCPSVADYAEQSPELAEDLRELLPAIAMVEQLSHKEHMDHVQSRLESRIAKRLSHRLGDFRIVREIGRGGMGIVYEAIQESLGRRVALKVLTAGAVHSPRRLQRFQREARAAAKLHHTNIVPIFGVGEEDGLHYYVMQYIDGRGLDRLIDGSAPPTEQSLGWRDVATCGLQIARAVDYAHRQGVLHRDIKPANLLLDSRGTVWVTDFGLAKVFGDDELTQSGDVLGTLRYMAPEQFAGQSTAAGDLYSIGITLYELATRRPAFAERDAKPLMLRITQGDLPRPRGVDRAIPVDLETIILKATAFEPTHRYAAAGDLADDLQRFLDGEPLAARPVSAARRLWRWSRRNPAVALLGGLSFLLLFLVAVVASVGYLRVEEARQRAVVYAAGQQRVADELRVATGQVLSESRRAKEEHARAEDNLRLAMSAFERIIDQVSQRAFPASLDLDVEDEERPPVELPLVTPADADLLQSLLEFYLEFAQHNEASEAVELETAKAYHRMGDIRLRLGQFEPALAAYDQALDRYDRIAERGEPDLQFALATAAVLNQRGTALAQSSRPRDALLAHAQARDRLLRQPDPIAGTRECRFALAETYLQIGSLWAPLEPAAGPPGGPRRRSPDGAGPGVPGTRGMGVFGGHGGPRLGPAAWWEARSQAPQRLLEQLIDEDPANAAYRLAMARYHRNAIPIAWRERRPDDAARSHQESLRILEQLRLDFPDHPRYAQELADGLSIDHPSWRETEHGRQAPERLERAVQLADDLHRASPHQPEYQVLLSNALYRLGLASRARGDLPAAITHLARSVRLLESLAAQFPTVSTYGVALGRTAHDLAAYQREAGQPRASRQTLDDALLHLLVMVQADNDPRLLRRSIAQLQASRRRLSAAL